MKLTSLYSKEVRRLVVSTMSVYGQIGESILRVRIVGKDDVISYINCHNGII